MKKGRLMFTMISCCAMLMISLFSVSTIICKTKKMSLSANSISLKVKKTKQVKVKNCSKKVKWTSKNTRIAKVTQKDCQRSEGWKYKNYCQKGKKGVNM